MSEVGFLSRAREARAGWQQADKEAKNKARDEAVKDYIVKHDTLDGFDMDKDYTKDYPQEDVLRQYCLYDSLYLFCLCLHCTLYEQDMKELSRVPKRKKTEVGHCQKVCQYGAKLQGTTSVAFWVSKFVPTLKSRGWDTSNKPSPKNWSDRENVYEEMQFTLDKEGIRLIRMRQGVSSGSDEQLGSSSQSTVTQTNVDKDDMEDFVVGEENVEDEEEVVRDDDDKIPYIHSE
jgi:hypothetical protein